MPAGYLVPPFHGSYWMGLNTTSYEWPQFYWLDRSPAPGLDTYRHWGSLSQGEAVSVPEPNNMYPPEYCGVANYSMAGDDKIWSWADTNCTPAAYPYICKVTRGWHTAGHLWLCIIAGNLLDLGCHDCQVMATPRLHQPACVELSVG